MVGATSSEGFLVARKVKACLETDPLVLFNIFNYSTSVGYCIEILHTVSRNKSALISFIHHTMAAL